MPSNTKTYHPEQSIIRAPEVARMIGCSVSHVWRLSKAGRLPRPIKPSIMVTGWVRSEIEQFIAARIAERDSQASTGKAA